MQRTKLSIGESPLLTYAVSKLRPAVFSHPIWLRFSEIDKPASSGVIEDLFSVVRSLKEDNPSDACQLLLICAVFQNYSGQRHKALKTAQQALSLAERSGLSQEILWALWGECAICIQQGNYEQAANHLVDLQAVLNEQNEWMLADFVDVLRQSLFQPVTFSGDKHSEWPRDRPFRDLLSLTFDWLRQWGFSAHSTESELNVISNQQVSHATTHSTLAQSFFSIQRWQGRWHTLMFAIRGELNLQWAEDETPRTKRRSSFWTSILSALGSARSGPKIDTEVIDNLPQIPSIPRLPPAEESSPHKATAHKNKPISKIEKFKGIQHAEQATTLMSVAVHMLGAFSMTIGDLRVKLRGSRGLSLLKYLLFHHKQNTPREVLMEVFWPDAEPETARNNLNVTMHSLRKALRTVIFLPVIAFEDGTYGLEPNLQVWLDVEEFERCVKAGQRLEARGQLTAAVAEYESAISLYQGDLLEQNPYEEWTILDRERLRITYLDTLDRLSQIYFSQERYAGCITSCQLILRRDSCREDAHCLLIRCYSRQGQYHLALRQYQICIEALRAELQVSPGPETQNLFERIRRRESI